MNNQNDQFSTNSKSHVSTGTSNALDKLKYLARKPWLWVIIVALAVVTVIILQPSADNNSVSTNPKSQYKLTIIDTEVIWDSMGQMIMVTYNFTNNSNEPISFMSAFDDKVYINGIALNYALGYDSIGNYYKEILNGTTAEIKVFYRYNYEKGPVQIIVKEQKNKSNTLISKTVELDFNKSWYE